MQKSTEWQTCEGASRSQKRLGVRVGVGVDIDAVRNRKPARRMIEIPEPVMLAMSEGLVPTKNLPEWLAWLTLH